MENNNEELTINQKMNQYIGQGFNQAQLEEIRIGLEDELDVTFYARVDMPASEMMYIRKELYKRHIQERQNETIVEKSDQDDSAIKQMQEIKARRELAIISIVMFAIATIVFFIFLTK